MLIKNCKIIDFFQYLLYNSMCYTKKKGGKNMVNNFKEAYKVKKTPVELSNEIQMGLRENEEYDKITDKQCEEILNYFKECYPQVLIQIPKKRKKTPRSINEKSKNKEIERLTYLYVAEGIEEEQLEELYGLIEKRIYENENLDTEKILENINNLLKKDIEQLNIEEFLNAIMIQGISNSTKKALLRILRAKIENSNIEQKQEKIQMLDEKYGKKAEELTGIPENNIMEYEKIAEIRENPEKMQALHNEVEYLKSSDLMGMKIIISSIPSDIQTDNERLKELIQLRDKATIRKAAYDNMAMQEISREFVNQLANNKQFLEKIAAEIIPNSMKHKNKTNGYEAYHIKIRNVNNPQYTLEIQAKSQYVENLAKGDTEAAHDKRPGKKRVIPSTEHEKEFMQQLRYTVPEYTIFENGKNGYKARKYNMTENTLSYFGKLISPGIELYEKVVKIIQNNTTKNKEK